MEMIEILIPIITAIASSSITYLFTRAKQKEETRTNELDNVQKALEVYRSIIKDLETDLEKTKSKIEELNTMINAIRKKCNSNCIN
jgi:predicted  nucleic acid-binding Zn-ribbon protein